MSSLVIMNLDNYNDTDTENDIHYLKKKHPHDRDKYIEFDEPSHTYTIKGKSDYTSVTTWVHQHFEPFDADKIIENMNVDMFLTQEENGELQNNPYTEYLQKNYLPDEDVYKPKKKKEKPKGLELFYNEDSTDN